MYQSTFPVCYKLHKVTVLVWQRSIILVQDTFICVRRKNRRIGRPPDSVNLAMSICCKRILKDSSKITKIRLSQALQEQFSFKLALQETNFSWKVKIVRICFGEGMASKLKRLCKYPTFRRPQIRKGHRGSIYSL